MTKTPLETQLTYYNTKLVLRLLSQEEQRLVALIKTSSDEDVISDADNDLIALRMLFEKLSAQAVELWGKGVTNFDGKPLWSE